jgi:hypothetical protein
MKTAQSMHEDMTSEKTKAYTYDLRNKKKHEDSGVYRKSKRRTRFGSTQSLGRAYKTYRICKQKITAMLTLQLKQIRQLRQFFNLLTFNNSPVMY